ncbi:MAG: universal stress protein [Halobacteriaceae archaeon]
MTRFLVATASVHTTAAACDYLAPRLAGDGSAPDASSDGDEVLVLAVVDGGVDERDAGDATNVAGVRLPATPVEVLTRTGDPASAIQSVASERDVDEVVLGARRPATGAEGPPASGPNDGGGLGSTAASLLAGADRPVVVLPRATPPDGGAR